LPKGFLFACKWAIVRTKRGDLPLSQKETDMNIYQENGYKNRAAYVASLAEERGVGEEEAFALASLLGPAEDFDGLVSALDDLAERCWG